MTADLTTEVERQVARRYLLDELAEAEADRFEARLLTDGEASDRVAALADDLVDDYIGGRLSRTQRVAFERRLRASSRLRERAAFARALARIVAQEAGSAAADEADEEAPAPRVARAASGQAASGQAAAARWPGRRTAPRWSQLAAAATIVLGIGSGWLLWRSESLRQEVLTLQSAQQEASDRLADLDGERAALAAETERLDRDLTAERAATAAARREAAELAAALDEERSAPPPAPVTTSFVLSAALRSELGERRFRLSGASERVHLTLDLGADEGFVSYLAVVHGPTGAELWSARGLAPSRGVAEGGGGLGTRVEIDLPAQLFTAGRHEVLLYGETPETAAPPELVGAFELDLERS